MNSDQITTTINHFATGVFMTLAALGWIDSATSSQLVTLIGQLMTEAVALLTTVMTIISIATAIWRRSHPQQMDAGARSIAAGADPTPVVQALRAEGATVNTSGMATTT